MPLPLLALLGGAAAGVAGNVISGFGQRSAAQAGMDQYAPLMELMSPEGRASFLDNYAQSAEGQQALAQGEESALKAASATGGLRTGQAEVAQREIAPMLGLNALRERISGLQSTVPGMANLATQKAGALPSAIGSSFGQLGGLGMYAGQGGFGQGGGVPMGTARVEDPHYGLL